MCEKCKKKQQQKYNDREKQQILINKSYKLTNFMSAIVSIFTMGA